MVTYRAIIESTDEWFESPSFKSVYAAAYWTLQMYDRDDVCRIYAVTDSRSYPEEGGCKWREKCELRCTLTATAEGEVIYCERVSDARPVALKRRTYKYVERED